MAANTLQTTWQPEGPSLAIMVLLAPTKPDFDLNLVVLDVQLKTVQLNNSCISVTTLQYSPGQ